MFRLSRALLTPSRLLAGVLVFTLASPAFAQAGPYRQAGDAVSQQDPTIPERRPVGPEEARQMLLNTTQVAQALLDVFYLGDPQAEASLSSQLALVRSRAESAAPEEMSLVASVSGDDLRRFERALAIEAYHLLSSAQPAKPRPETETPTTAAGAPRKSAGFPALRTDLPEDPNIGAGAAALNVVLAPIEDLMDAVASLGDTIGGSGDIELCSYVVDPMTGRAVRRNNLSVWNDHVGMGVAELSNTLLHDFCGGMSADVVVISGGYSCDLCCINYDLAHGLIKIIHDMKYLCEDMIDEAEAEATYHHVKTTYDAVAHVHGDVEAVQATADEILDAVTCKPVPAFNKNHGCDGADSDCNGLIDDCGEDVFGPDVHVDEAVGAPWYASQAEAIAAVLRAVSASDDCKAATVSLDSVSGSCGSFEAVIAAVDGCGNTTTARAAVKVDPLAPTVSLPTSLAGSCHASIDAAEAAVLAAALIADDCTPAGQLEVAVQSTVTDCALRVRVTATDLAGRSATGAVTVRVDAREPEVDIEKLLLGLGGGRTACFATVAEAEAAVLAATDVTDNCSAGAALRLVTSSSGSPCSLRVRASVTDECGRASADDVIVRVDGAAPSVSATVRRSVLWPANHELVDVGFAYSAADDCDGEPEVRVLVTSDEPTSLASGAGQDKSPDATLLREPGGPVQGVRLRAERSSSGNGRVYRILVEATDPCGNVGRQSVRVSVPASSGSTAVDDGQFFDATELN